MSSSWDWAFDMVGWILIVWPALPVLFIAWTLAPLTRWPPAVPGSFDLMHPNHGHLLGFGECVNQAVEGPHITVRARCIIVVVVVQLFCIAFLVCVCVHCCICFVIAALLNGFTNEFWRWWWWFCVGCMSFLSILHCSMSSWACVHPCVCMCAVFACLHAGVCCTDEGKEARNA